MSTQDRIGLGRVCGIAALVLVGSISLLWIFQGNNFVLYKIFAPKMEQVRHDTFKESQAYNDGMLQNLRKSQMEYAQASDEHKLALGSIVLHDFAAYDRERLPTDLKDFLVKLEAEQSKK